MLLYAGISLLCSVVAFIAWRWAKRGRRIDLHPICRKCGYDMYGRDLDELPDCPECGTQIWSRKQLRLGNRKPNKVLSTAALGVTLLALIASIGFTTLWGRDYDWNRVKPASRLMNEAAKSNNPAIVKAALDELERRFENHLLSEQQIKQLIDTALDYQADLSKPWDNQWGDWICEAWIDTIATDQQWARFLSQRWQRDFRVRQRIVEGDRFILALVIVPPERGDPYHSEDIWDKYPEGFYSSFGDDTAIFELYRVIHGMPESEPLFSFTDKLDGFTQDWGENSHGMDRLSPGRYRLKVTIDQVRYSMPGRKEQTKEECIDPIDFYSDFEVLPKGSQFAKPVHDPQLASQVQADIAAMYMQSQTNAAKIKYYDDLNYFYVDYWIPEPNLPCYGSFQIELEINGQRFLTTDTIVFSPTTSANAQDGSYGHSFYLPSVLSSRNTSDSPPNFDKLTLRLIPNPEYLKYYLDGYDYLDHIIEIKDIPVEPYRK